MTERGHLLIIEVHLVVNGQGHVAVLLSLGIQICIELD